MSRPDWKVKLRQLKEDGAITAEERHKVLLAFVKSRLSRPDIEVMLEVDNKAASNVKAFCSEPEVRQEPLSFEEELDAWEKAFDEANREYYSLIEERAQLEELWRQRQRAIETVCYTRKRKPRVPLAPERASTRQQEAKRRKQEDMQGL